MGLKRLLCPAAPAEALFLPRPSPEFLPKDLTLPTLEGPLPTPLSGPVSSNRGPSPLMKNERIFPSLAKIPFQ